MLAVLPRFGEHRAAAAGLDPLAGQLHRDGEGLGLVGPHATVRDRAFDRHRIDRPAAEILEPTQEGAGAEKAPESAVAEGGECV